ncbi:LYR motif-containing protein 9-like [Mya arenaria]|uniref:LYR motif-containing protein 9-like n=1 Tax=Mya arenaria TaxID=6604 RepID=UPI0022E0CCB3|nr:LYR motif-containing protein 9-like [Mya arenaria]
MGKDIHTPIQLYRHLFRRLERLPKSMQGHYKHQVRQQFRSHADEIDSERIQQIIKKSLEDCDWLINKPGN